MKKVLLLVPKGAEVFETAAFFDVLGWASLEGDEPIEVVTAGLEREVTCTFGLRLLPDTLLSEVEIDDFDALAVPGGFEEYGFYEHAFADEVGELIRAFRPFIKTDRIDLRRGAAGGSQRRPGGTLRHHLPPRGQPSETTAGRLRCQGDR